MITQIQNMNLAETQQNMLTNKSMNLQEWLNKDDTYMY